VPLVAGVCAGELLQQVRSQFEAQRSAEGAEKIKHLLQDGRQQLKRLREMLGLVNLTI
jgi:hypothetical protein